MFLSNLLFSSEHKSLFIPIRLYFIKRYVRRVKTFHKTVNKAWNLFNLSKQSLENFTKNPISRFSISRKLLSIDQVLFSIGWTGIKQRSRHLETLGFFFTIFDRLSQSFDWSKILIFEFSLRKFQNLNFHFIKPYSPNSNIIITIYPCIYLYIQQLQPIKSIDTNKTPRGKSTPISPQHFSTQLSSICVVFYRFVYACSFSLYFFCPIKFMYQNENCITYTKSFSCGIKKGLSCVETGSGSGSWLLILIPW